MALGLTDRTNNGGLATYTNGLLEGRQGSYGADTGISYTGNSLATSVTIGITTDSSKSGIVLDTTSFTLSCEYIIKY